MMTPAPYTYTGKDRNGIPRSGRVPAGETLAGFVNRLSAEGFLWAAVVQHDGSSVGGIGFNMGTGEPVRWSDDDGRTWCASCGRRVPPGHACRFPARRTAG